MTGMLRIATVLVVLLAAAACSSLIPPQSVDDLFGIDGAEVALAATGTMAVGPPATTFAGAFEGRIVSDGIDAPGLIGGVVNASGMEETVTFATSVTVSVPGEEEEADFGPFPIATASISLLVRDGATVLGTAAGAATFSPGIVVSPGTCAFDGENTTCTYTAAVDAEAHAVVVSASSESARGVFDAIEAGGTFVVEGELVVTLASPGLTASATVVVTLETSDATITF